MLAVALHHRDQGLSLRDTTARLVIATGKKKGHHPWPTTVMRMLRPALLRAFLETAAPGYLTDTEWELLPGDWLEQALDDTAKPAKGVRGPLTPIQPRPGVRSSSAGGPAWQLADFLDQHGHRARREEIPPGVLSH